MPEAWTPPPELSRLADLDHDRGARRGYPEAVYCEGKSVEQVRLIAAAYAARHNPPQRTPARPTPAESAETAATTALPPQPTSAVLFTRASAEHAAAVLAELPDAVDDREARLVAWPPTPPEPTGGLVVVAAAGTSDLSVAREAELTARYLGRRTVLVMDVGVAGLHRVLARLDLLRSAAAIVVVAGMDGALPAVVAGLVSAPVVAVPTSVGYGAAFSGLAPLLSMLNACAPGVGVVNIDNGYGGGHLAAQIAATAGPGDGTAGETR
ncbi:nickel pincer cofactor biosynthesis protein LarB [Occultella glacieicola]|uniref:Nickel pincer cofactor biosynthesis protein LarB n=1 Tax=Occultella glacieicola TaxID=2518684 RepID=A0ABY2DZ40_9MICO|nr:nickel pincer cofactor biosynthesis protein LarB [Occultella glacieicola]TDE89620.1 nickel pincer cofactor biosynthesis protein LarB [Occultella glacieicola]